MRFFILHYGPWHKLVNLFGHPTSRHNYSSHFLIFKRWGCFFHLSSDTLMLHLAHSSLAVVVEAVESNYKRANVLRMTITCLRSSIIISQSFTISFFFWYLKDVFDNPKSWSTWSKNCINAENLFSCKRHCLSCKRSILLCNCTQLAWWIDVIDVPSVLIKIYL